MPAQNETELREYQDLDLGAIPGPAAHTFLVTVHGSAGQASDQTTLDPADAPWRTALAAIERDETSAELFFELGARLFQALFPSAVEAIYRASMGHAKGEGKGLRLRLRLDQASQLGALPWEYLYDPQRDIFMGISSDTPLSRFIEPPHSFPPPPPLEGKLRLLTVISQPLNLAPINADAVFETMDQALQRLKARGRLEEIEPLRHAVRADITEALREYRPHVLHWVGHGAFDRQARRGKLFLEDTDGDAVEMSDRTFRELLEGHTDIRLVVLDVGESATRDAGDALVGIAPQLVRRGVPAVVAKQYHVGERAAISLTREFYRALTHWYPIDVALSDGRRAIYQDYGGDRRDWAAPVLFMRDRDGMLFEPPTQSPVSRPGIPDQAIDPAVLEQVCASYVEAPHKFYLPSRTRLLQILKTHFQLEELRELCVELGVDYENFAPTKDALARELVLYAERRSMARALVEAAYRRRPKAEW